MASGEQSTDDDDAIAERRAALRALADRQQRERELAEQGRREAARIIREDLRHG